MRLEQPKLILLTYPEASSDGKQCLGRWQTGYFRIASHSVAECTRIKLRWRRRQAGTAEPKTKPPTWDVGSSESNNQTLRALRRPVRRHVTVAVQFFFFLFFSKYGWASPWNAGRVSFNNVYDCEVLFGQRVPLRKRRPFVTLCHFREFVLLPRRASRSDNLSVCLSWQNSYSRVS